MAPSSPPRPLYPRWPDVNEESEYCEVPPEHFLAQQGKAASRRFPTGSSGYVDQYGYEYVENQPVAGSSRLPQDGPVSPLRRQSLSATSSTSTSSGAADPSSDASQSPLPLAGLAELMASNGFSELSLQPQQQYDASQALPDTATLAGADFDIDVRSGFLPPEAPLDRLPDHLEEGLWERMLTQGRQVGLKINGGGVAVGDEERRACRAWRRAIREMPIVRPSHTLQTDFRHARRGHVVLTFLAHFYMHSQPQPSKAAEATYGKWLSTLWNRKRTSKAEIQDLQDAQDEVAGRYAAHVPASIAVPLLALSAQLDIPPVLTYADTVLWNWRFKDASRGLRADNFEIVETFSDTASEHHFFLTSLLIEFRGVAALDIMRTSLDECFLGDALAKRRVAAYLNRLCEIIADLTQILHDVRTECDPAIFYWGIRPWFRGGDSSPHEVKGWYYHSSRDESAEAATLEPQLFTGPSAGQSSLIHSLDVFFDVDHAGTKARASRSATSKNPTPVNGTSERVVVDNKSMPEDATFMQRMQLYMPGQHRRFLTHLQSLTAEVDEDDVNVSAAKVPAVVDDDAMDVDSEEAESTPAAPAPTPLRHLASTALLSSPTHPLPQAYDRALQSLKSLRDEHMRVATLYIVSQARSTPPREYAELNKDFVGGTLVDSSASDAVQQQSGANTESEAEAEEAAGGGAKGTGGTDLVKFLKACRKNTLDTLLS